MIEKMLTKLFVFGLLCGTVIQALPPIVPLHELRSHEDNAADDEIEFRLLPSNNAEGSTSELIPDDKQKSCSEKLEWFKQTTEKLKGFYDLYYLSFQNHKLNTIQSRELEAKHVQFEDMVKETLKRYEEDKEKFFSVSKDSLQATLCIKEINWFKLMDHDLAGIANSMKTDVSKVLEVAGVPKETRDSIDAALSRVVNFLIIIDMTKNTFKDLGQLINELNKKTVKTIDGLKPEKDNEIDLSDVDYGEDALDVDLDKEEDTLKKNFDELEDNTEIEEAEERLNKNEEEIKEAEIEEQEPVEREPFYEFVPPRV